MIAKIGASLICVSTILMWASHFMPSHKRKTMWIGVILLTLVGILDLILLAQGQQTITRYIRSILTGWVGICAMCFLVFHTWLIFGIRGLLPALNAVIWGHLFW